MTNEQLGQRIGVTVSMASRLRSGHRRPGIETLQRIKEAFNADWDELMGKHNEGTEAFAAYLEGLITKDDRAKTPTPAI